jgi:predicted phosphodiesterase
MRILVISDVHANIQALDAVLKAAGEVEAVYCLGDLVGYGPDPIDVIDKLQNIGGLECILGNHDAAVIGQINLASFNDDARRNIEWAQNQITTSNFRFLQTLPIRKEIGVTTLVHGSPRNPVWEYLLDTLTVKVNFYHFITQVCLVGHTHLPIIYSDPRNSYSEPTWRTLQDGESIKIDGRMLINPGSVGQPRNHDPRASFAILDTETLIWKSRRIAYDIVSVQQRIYQAGLPRRHALRLSERW